MSLLLAQNNQMRDALELTGKVQRESMPINAPFIKGYDTGVKWIPSRYAGGDFYDFILPKTGSKDPGSSEVAFVVADVVDKDAPAALVAGMIHALVHAHSFRYSIEQTMLQVNFDMREVLKSEDKFATMLYGILSPEAGVFEFARMGHELPVVYDGDKRRIDIPIAPGEPLNFSLTPNIHIGSLDIPHGGKMFLTTDGLFEAPGY